MIEGRHVKQDRGAIVLVLGAYLGPQISNLAHKLYQFLCKVSSPRVNITCVIRDETFRLEASLENNSLASSESRFIDPRRCLPTRPALRRVRLARLYGVFEEPYGTTVTIVFGLYRNNLGLVFRRQSSCLRDRAERSIMGKDHTMRKRSHEMFKLVLGGTKALRMVFELSASHVPH